MIINIIIIGSITFIVNVFSDKTQINMCACARCISIRDLFKYHFPLRKMISRCVTDRVFEGFKVLKDSSHYMKTPVSYTHLDVYKRQSQYLANITL